MLQQDQLARWVIGLDDRDQADELTSTFLACSSRAWPCALAHARRELSGKALDTSEIDSLALEVWEGTLRSVWRTWRERPNKASRIENLESYLIGAFLHRLNRRLKRQRLRDSVLEFHPVEELAAMQGAANLDEDSAPEIQRGIQLQEAYAAMNPNIRLAIAAKLYGFSWPEISQRLHIDEQNLIMRVQYAIRKIRSRFSQAGSPDRDRRGL